MRIKVPGETSRYDEKNAVRRGCTRQSQLNHEKELEGEATLGID